MGWRVAIYTEASTNEEERADLQGYDELCRWIREHAGVNAELSIHVVAPHDAAQDQLLELRRAGVRVSFAT